MCGIFGYIGNKNATNVCIQGLKQLEYRGYDSAGIAGLLGNSLLVCKDSGKVATLEKKISLQELKLDLAIGHTRWATHGKPTKKNAHPHNDSSSSIAIVHNGIIENYNSLRDMLINEGVSFQSETDTEVIVQLISHYYNGDLLKALKKALEELKGSFAIALVHKEHPDQIYAATRESPLSIGYSDDRSETILSSDPNAFLGRNLNVLFLQNDEIALLKSCSFQIYGKNMEIVDKKVERFEGEFTPPSKEGFEHFMLKEIYEQPVTLRKATLIHSVKEFGTAQFNDLNISPQELLATRHILILACGTSWHAGCIAAAMLEEKARIPTQSEIASELRYKNMIISEDTLVIAISQSGETADTLAAVREAKSKGAKVLGICNVKNSTLTRESDSCIFLNAGPEISVCSTKAFTSQLAILSLFTLYMARLRHMDKKDGQDFLSELDKMPDKIKQVLDQTKHIQFLAEKYSSYENFFFLGRKYMYPTGLEAALKLKEISYLNATGYPAGELKHGPIALISPLLPVIAFCANKQTYDKIVSNLMEVKARGAPVLAFASEGSKGLDGVADDIIWLPSTIDELAMFPTTVAGQLLAYFIAKSRNREIDQPRNLAKSVTVE